MKFAKRRCFKIKTKIQSFLQFVVNLFRDYSDHSTIHGVSYIGEKGRSWFERFWWVAAIGVSAFCCAQLIIDAWNIDPIIISFNEKPTPIWQIPFPAVTICPNILADYRHINLSMTIYRNCLRDSTRKQRMQLHALSMLYLNNMLYDNPKRYPHCNGCLNLLREMKIPPRDIFTECKFRNQPINCLTSLQETALRYALCYTFNGFDVYRHLPKINESALPQEWTIDEGYNATETIDTYPRRAFRAGTQNGLSVLLRLSKHNFQYKFASTPGFWVEYRMPYDTPELSTKYFNIQMGTSVDFIVKPKMMTTADELQKYPKSERKCLFSTKQSLKYFKQYTQTNCEIECEVNYIVKYCKCHPFYIENYRKNMTCGLAHMECVSHHNYNLLKRNFAPCGCLPACTTITYDTEVSVTALNKSSLTKVSRNARRMYEYTQLTIYFKENQFVTSERRVIYGQAGFLANCGGLLGLFLGISVVSILEMIYFCTIRLWCKARKPKTVISDCDHSLVTEDHSNNYLKIMKNLIVDYSSKTTIQGINYLFDTKLSSIERIWWIIIVGMSGFCCGSLIYDAIRHYDQFPIIVKYANEETPIYKIPFPAVTICPQFVSNQISHWYNRLVIQKRSLYTERKPLIELVTIFAQVCDSELFSDIDPENRTDCEICRRDLERMMQDINVVITGCSHIKTAEKCSKMFKQVMTEVGICFTYNGLDVYRDQVKKNTTKSKFEHWNLDDGYRNVSQHWDVFPSAGSKLPLVISLEIDNRMSDGLCKGPIRGYKVYLHLPNEVPQISKHYYLIPFRQMVQILVNPRMVITAPDLRDLSVSKRQCYFSDERYLRFFKYYTQNNCEAECVANLTMTKCGCLRFYMPKIPGVKLCGISDIRCYQNAIETSVEQSIRKGQLSDCGCLPTCNAISYETEVNQIIQTNESIRYQFNDERSLKHYGCTADADEYNDEYDEYDYNRMDAIDYVKEYSISSFNVVFRENQFVAMERSQLYGPTELMANFGGLLGLFLGFSVMSVLELIYFCTIRLLCSYKMSMFKKF